MGNRYGFHSGVVHAKTIECEGNFNINGNITFADVSAGALSISGGLDLTGTTKAIGINMTGGTFATAAIQIGSSGSKMSITTNPVVDINTTSAYTSSSQVRSVEISQTQTAASYTNKLEVLYVTLASEYRTGDWANAIVGRIDYGTTGDASGGMAAAICAELNYPGKACAGIGGANFVLDLEMNCPTNFTCSTNLSYPQAFLNFGFWGNSTAMGTWEDYGFLLRTDGFTAASGNIISANSQTARVRIESNSRYLVLSQLEDALSLDSCATAITLGDSVSAVGIEIGNVPIGISLDGDFTDGIKIAGSNTIVDGIDIATCSTHAINISSAQTGAGITIASTCGTYGLNIAGACTTAGILLSTTNILSFRDSGLYLYSSTDGQLDIVADAGILLTCPGANKVAVGGLPDFSGAGGSGTILTGSGYDSALIAVARCTSADLPANAYSAGFTQLTVTDDQGNAGSWFGSWNELYLYGSSLDLTGAANFAGVFAVLECSGATGVSTDDTDWMAGVGANIVVATTGFTNNCQFCGIHVDSAVNAGTSNAGNGRFSAFECDIASGREWDYGLYLNDYVTGIYFAETGAATEHLIDVVDAYTGMVIETGSYSSDASKGVTLSSSNTRPVTFLADAGGADLAAGNYRGVLSRVYIHVNQSDQIALRAIRGQVKLGTSVTSVNIGANEFGSWNAVEGYLESSATGTCTIGANTRYAGLHAFLEFRADATVSSGGICAGLLVEIGHDSKTLTGEFSAIYIDMIDSDHGWTGKWNTGIKIANNSCTTGISIGTVSGSGIAFTSTVAKGIDFTGVYAAAASASGLIMGCGTSATPATTSTASEMFIEFRCKSEATSGDNRLMYLRYDAGGSGTWAGECLRAFSKVTGAVANVTGANFACIFDNTSGSASGSASGLSAQLNINTSGQTTGTVYAADFNIWNDGEATNGLPINHAILGLRATGDTTGAAKVLNAIAFQNAAGEGTGEMIYNNNSSGASESNGSIRILVDEGSGYVARYLRYWDSENS